MDGEEHNTAASVKPSRTGRGQWTELAGCVCIFFLSSIVFAYILTVGGFSDHFLREFFARTRARVYVGGKLADFC